ncbi:hypothetical protein QJS66_14945 [Kocuria rhizophila]|nr:hypothetical protein QJS66_14945 [Kocuria rhizophila]
MEDYALLAICTGPRSREAASTGCASRASDSPAVSARCWGRGTMGAWNSVWWTAGGLRRYVPETFILQTEWRTSTGRARHGLPAAQ